MIKRKGLKDGDEDETCKGDCSSGRGCGLWFKLEGRTDGWCGPLKSKVKSWAAGSRLSGAGPLRAEANVDWMS